MLRWTATTNALDIDNHIVAMDEVLHLFQLALRKYSVHMLGQDTYKFLAQIVYKHLTLIRKVGGESHFVTLSTG